MKYSKFKKCPNCGSDPTFEPAEDIFLMCPCGWVHPDFRSNQRPADELPEYD
jgi:hypothetical protein